MKYILFLLLNISSITLVKAIDDVIYKRFEIRGYTQGTTYNIVYYSSDSILKSQVDSILNVIDLSMSIYKSESLISSFNNIKTKKVLMDYHMQNVINKSFEINNLTDGFFDITVMPLINLWGFGPNGFTKEPSLDEIKNIKKIVGLKHLKIKDEYLIKKKRGVSIDVNGIAQGYTVDVLYDFFLSKNINDFLIEIGGEIRTHGSKPNGNFIVEVQRPFNSQGETNYKIKLFNQAITTSGSYEKTLKINGKRVSHHINPFTGFPVDNKTLSVTVIAKSAMLADAIDNYLIYISPDKAIEFVEKQLDMEVYIVFVENNTLKELKSSGFNNYIYN